MGVCQECLVTIDGHPGRRACAVSVSDGMQIQRQAVRSPLQWGAGAYVTPARTVIEEPDVLIIGGGPGGMTAGAIAAELGAEVVVLDDRARPGGQYYKQPAALAQRPPSLVRDRQYADGKRLIERLERAGAHVTPGVEVWGAFADGVIAASNGRTTTLFRPKRLVVATGAYERAVPFPGWTLPGVITTGAAQTLLRAHGVLPGRRILVAGNGPLNLQVALELQRAGAEVVAIAQEATSLSWRAILPASGMLSAAPRLAARGIALLASLRAAGVPVLGARNIVSVERADDGLRVSLRCVAVDRVDHEQTFDVDTVCLGFGFLPNSEILRLLGCRHRYVHKQGALHVERNRELETSVAGVYAIGDCCGLRGAPTALQEGIVAAVSAVASLGLPVPRAARRSLVQARFHLRRHRAFQSALWSLFRAPVRGCEFATATTPVCRCECVTLADVKRAIDDGCSTPADIKRRTRLGMGACQGRYCLPALLVMLQRDGTWRGHEYSVPAPRVPVRPVRLCELRPTTRMQSTTPP